jgi:hypothetical protein
VLLQVRAGAVLTLAVLLCVDLLPACLSALRFHRQSNSFADVCCCRSALPAWPVTPRAVSPRQASTNTLLAHLVSVVFLTFMIRKITAAYQRVLEWGENLSKSMPRL